jgi:hypothetical protein
VSSSIFDAAASIGALTVKITGLQYVLAGSTHTYVPHSQIVTMNGTTDVSVDDYYRVLKLEVMTVGSGATNHGKIKVYDGASAVYACMGILQGKSNMLLLSPRTNYNLLVKTMNCC